MLTVKNNSWHDGPSMFLLRYMSQRY